MWPGWEPGYQVVHRGRRNLDPASIISIWHVRDASCTMAPTSFLSAPDGNVTDDTGSTGVMDIVRLGLLVAFLVGSAVAIHHAGALDGALVDARGRIDKLGFWGPVAFIGAYALLVSVTFPGTLATVLGATLFPIGEAFVYVILGAMLGSSVSFAIGRFLGRDAVEGLLSKGDSSIFERIRAMTQTFEDNGVMAVAYLRMAYVPFVVLNYLAPLTGIRFRDFFVGTFFGILTGTFVFVFMGNTLGDVIQSGDLSGLMIWKTPVSIALFALSLVLPWWLNRRFKRHDTGPEHTS